ncbi:hypothetical protein [Burkholderia gladioli]|uniref:hypothetical protein n=1 Tax=Burkholderia gladioli TaxID=28095 RepID=UPI001C5DA8F0|nr:hypothetical protein [Burkholderia gladioli]MBW5284180.1 hypothetical protein [Burkholderia gladioli]
MQVRFTTCFISAFACAVTLALAGCGTPDHIELAGLRLGMTQAEVKAAAPAGAALYCRGGGDPAFDQVSGLPESTTLRFCTWTAADSSTGQRTFAQVQIGSDTSSKVQLVFDYGGNSLQSVGIEVLNNAYARILKTFTDKFGSPDSSSMGMSMPMLGGAHWDAKYDTLTISVDDMHPYITNLMLVAKPAKTN